MKKEIQKYMKYVSCPKCGNDFITTTFDNKGDYPTGNMLRECGECGYWWYQKPLDADEPSNQQL